MNSIVDGTGVRFFGRDHGVKGYQLGYGSNGTLLDSALAFTSMIPFCLSVFEFLKI